MSSSSCLVFRDPVSPQLHFKKNCIQRLPPFLDLHTVTDVISASLLHLWQTNQKWSVSSHSIPNLHFFSFISYPPVSAGEQSFSPFFMHYHKPYYIWLLGFHIFTAFIIISGATMTFDIFIVFKTCPDILPEAPVIIFFHKGRSIPATIQ